MVGYQRWFLVKFGLRVAPGFDAAIAVMSCMNVPNPLFCCAEYSAAGALRNG
jgi:hypothetical protein